MKYICNQCDNVYEADDITIHYTQGENGFEIFAICNSCLEKYLETRKEGT
jgi:hypothetical protein